MGKIGEEITQKIKSAVKAKLIELGIEVDNELPDYIMVLVANKKTQPQMEKDLHLFLGPNTVLFTTWLINVLKKLEEVTVSKKNYKRIEVTSEEGSLVVTKKEEDLEKKRALKTPVRIKVEPGTAGPETSVSNLDKDLNTDKGEDSNLPGSVEQESNSDEDEGARSVPKNVASPSKDQESPEQSLENISNDEDNSLEKSSHHDDQEDDAEPLRKNISPENLSRDNESDENLKSSDRPKIVYGITEQIDEVMEKTMNGNRRPRDEREGSVNDEDRNSGRKSSDNFKSLHNDFYGKRRSRSGDRSRGDRSPDSYERGKSPEPRRRMYSDRRSPDSFRRSPVNRRRGDFGRKSPELRRRSPFNRRRSPDDHRRSPFNRRRSPDDYRRSPINRRRSPDDYRRSPINRRRSPFERRRSPIDRRRSPTGRKWSPEDKRRSFEDRGRRDDLRRSPDNRSKLKMTDAREILKRKSTKNDESHRDLSPNDDSHRSEKRRKTVSSLVHKPEAEREKAVEPQIPSLVRVTPRPLRKEAIQPNKKLLLLAVADAEKSIARPLTKRQELPPLASSSRKREVPKCDERKAAADRDNQNSGYIPPEKIFITLTNNKASSKDLESSGKFGGGREVSAKKLYEDTDLTIDDELLYDEQYFDYEQDDADEIYAAGHQDEYVPLPVKEKNVQATKSNLSMLFHSSEAKCIISLESSPERSCEEWEDNNSKTTKKEPRRVVLKEIESPIDESLEDSSILEVEKSEEAFEWNRLGPAPVAAIKPLTQGVDKVEKYRGEAVNKALERCKFWPGCLSGTCIYYHPTSPCKLFPLCKSGKECLFIHPECKFGADCLNPKCTFLHKPLEEKSVKAITTPVKSLPTGKPNPPVIKCSYFPNCKNLNCKFWHPVKNCKYGRTCARSDCYFFHPTLVIPPKELLTWTSRT